MAFSSFSSSSAHTFPRHPWRTPFPVILGAHLSPSSLARSAEDLRRLASRLKLLRSSAFQAKDDENGVRQG
jgi:hypothetical protein